MRPMTLCSDRTGSTVYAVSWLDAPRKRREQEKIPRLPMKEIGGASDVRWAVLVLS